MLKPTTEQELSDIIRDAQSALAIQGGGTRGVHVEGTKLTTTGISGITTYEPGALTLVAKAGTPISEIEAALASENQMLAFEPMDHRTLLGTTGEPTIGGVVAANISGPRRVQAGACRDFLLGVRFVDGRGEVVQNGGRVMKNVTGYDIARLQCGAHGTLGVLTEVGLKVLPKPAYTSTLIYRGLGHTATQAILTQAMKSPYEVSGAARLPAGALEDQSLTVLRLEGFEGSVKYRSKALADCIDVNPGQEEIETDPEQNKKIWDAVCNITPFADRAGDIWRVSIKPTDFAWLTHEIDQEDKLVDWACGLVWIRVPEGTDVRSILKGKPGHATLIRGGANPVSRFEPESEPLSKLAAGLRQQFDPRGILNPGLMG